MNSLPSCKSEVSPRFLLLSLPSPSPSLILSSLILLQQKLVWVSRLGWPRTKISQTQFSSESISKLIIWRAGGTWSCLGWGTNEKKSRANRRSIILQRSAISIYRPPLCSPMMSYADNEAWGNTLARTQCALHMCVFQPQHQMRPPTPPLIHSGHK